MILCDSLVLEIRESGCCQSPDDIRNGLCVILVRLFLLETSNILKDSTKKKKKKKKQEKQQSVRPCRML